VNGTGSRVILTTRARTSTTRRRTVTRPTSKPCQGCHLHYDRNHHARTRAQTRHTALETGGQLTFEL
jgi:hypothetical protein